MFTEREAIQFEMEELKEQARRDFEIYLTSRNMRNERYTQLMDRLREIDRGAKPVATHREEFAHKKQEATLVRDLPKPKFDGSLQDLRVDKFRPNQEIVVKNDDSKKEEPKKYRDRPNKPKSYVKIEDIDPLVEKYLKFRQTEERTKDIQAYAEKELNQKWVNFSAIMARLIELNPRIKRSDRKGFYYYESNI